MLVTSITVALVAFGTLLLYAQQLHQRAESNLRDVYELSQQKQSPTFADIRKRFGNRLKQLDGCSPSECGYIVTLSNRGLAALRISEYTEIALHFWTKNGLLVETMVDYTTTVDRRSYVVSHTQIDLCAGCQKFAIHPWNDSSPLDTNGLVEIGKEAPAQNIRTALALDTRCLTEIGGCKTVAELLPTVWQQTENKRIACRIPNDKGFVTKPATWP